MQILRDAGAMELAIESWTDRALADHLAEQLAGWREYGEVSEIAHVILVESADTAQQLSAALNVGLFGEIPAETMGRSGHELCLRHPSFIEVVFIVSDDGFGYEVLIPKDTNAQIWALFEAHAIQAVMT